MLFLQNVAIGIDLFIIVDLQGVAPCVAPPWLEDALCKKRLTKILSASPLNMLLS